MLEMDCGYPQRTVVAKPTASRPLKFQSFSELLSGTSSEQTLETFVQKTLVVRPRVMRIKPSSDRAELGINLSQEDRSEVAVFHSSDQGLKNHRNSVSIYKPLAKPVSQKTVALLENLRNAKRNKEGTARMDHSSIKTLDDFSQIERKQENHTYQKQNEGALLATVNSDKPSFDGYNWKKYGQKVVKGSEFPRSYYKCTHPNCPVKKKIERQSNGKIAAVIYKSEHNHPKPPPPKRSSSEMQENNQESKNQLWGHSHPGNVKLDGKMEDQNEYPFSNHNCFSRTVPNCELADCMPLNDGCRVLINQSCDLSNDGENHSMGTQDVEFARKRRKYNENVYDTMDSMKIGQESNATVLNLRDSEILADGYRWRKYGQKAVKGNAFPRSYYRCTNVKCDARKYVEKTLDDPNSFITTYQGKHNHDKPIHQKLK